MISFHMRAISKHPCEFGKEFVLEKEELSVKKQFHWVFDLSLSEGGKKTVTNDPTISYLLLV